MTITQHHTAPPDRLHGRPAVRSRMPSIRRTIRIGARASA
ncbi:hypothetical protein FHR34_000162 [Kitasatospora kifunensis]|uniref:Uncharacterized protein n=1 Tax=Kitasatospora kifunensis TaxID=58351 RepID=A0A7W7QX23_KITKI|nr:hypothetical protein [Kitasatospora kifunensis]